MKSPRQAADQTNGRSPSARNRSRSREVALCHKKMDGTATKASRSAAIPTSLEQYVTLICLNQPHVAIHNERVSLIASEGDK